MRPESSQSRRLVKTTTPGIYKRGGSYVVVYRDLSGRQHKQAAKTMAEARVLKSSLNADVRRGEWRETSKMTFLAYAPEWVASYAGRTSRGFRQTTRDEYRRDLGFDKDGTPVDRAAAFFGRMLLVAIDPRTVKQYLAHLAAEDLAPATIKKLLAPLRAMFATAVEDGLLRYNPATGVRVPATSKPQNSSRRKNLTDAEYARLLTNVPAVWRLLVEFMLATGLRISEAIGLEWQDVDLEQNCIRIRQRYYKGIDEPKSEFGKRRIPLTPEMTQRLREARVASNFSGDTDPVFASEVGTRLSYSNLYHRVMQPAMRAAGIDWGAWHRLRHSCGTELGRRPDVSDSQVQLWLGHHDAGFTARTYIHLDSGDLPDPALLDSFGKSGPRRLRKAS
jgi:integrase